MTYRATQGAIISSCQSNCFCLLTLSVSDCCYFSVCVAYMSRLNGENQTDMSAISLVSWNVRGLGHAVKWGKVFAHLKSLKTDIEFLQQSHIKATEQRRLRAKWISQVYQSLFTSKARGVAILFCKSIPFQLASVTMDQNGRYIMITVSITSFPVTFLNIQYMVQI